MVRGFASGLICGAVLGVVAVAAVSQVIDYRTLERPSVAPPVVPAGSAFRRGREDAQPSLPAAGGGRPRAPAAAVAPSAAGTRDGPPVPAKEGVAAPQLVTAPARTAEPPPLGGSAVAATVGSFDDGAGQQPSPAPPGVPNADSRPGAVRYGPAVTAADRPDAPTPAKAGRAAVVSGSLGTRPDSAYAVAPQSARPGVEPGRAPDVRSASRPAVAAQARMAPPPGADAAPHSSPAAEGVSRPAGAERQAPALPAASASGG